MKLDIALAAVIGLLAGVAFAPVMRVSILPFAILPALGSAAIALIVNLADWLDHRH
jgi:hypothetical protein